MGIEYLISNNILPGVNFIGDLLSPFEGLDLLKIYSRFPQFIDFILFSVIFIGLAQAILHKKFEGKGGKAVIIGFGLSLALGLVLVEKQWGFSLMSFGHIAFAILLVLMALFTFKLVFQATEMSMIMKICLSYIVMFVMLNIIANKFFLYITGKAPFIHGVLVLCLIIAGIRLIIMLSSGFSKFKAGSLGVVDKGFKNIMRKVKPEASDLHKEKRIEKRGLGNFIHEEEKESRIIINELDDIIDLIDEYEVTGKGGRQIIDKLKDIISREHIVSKRINEIKWDNKRLESFDYGLLKDFKQEYIALPDTAKKYIRKEIIDEKKKIGIEEKIKYFENLLGKLDTDFKYTLGSAINHLKLKEFEDAKSLLEKARSFESSSQKVSDDLGKLEKHLVKLTNKGLRILKKFKHMKK